MSAEAIFIIYSFFMVGETIEAVLKKIYKPLWNIVGNKRVQILHERLTFKAENRGKFLS